MGFFISYGLVIKALESGVFFCKRSVMYQIDFTLYHIDD